MTCNNPDTFAVLDLMGFEMCRCLMRTWTTTNDGRVLPPAGHHKKLSNIYLFCSPSHTHKKVAKQKQDFCFWQKGLMRPQAVSVNFKWRLPIARNNGEQFSVTNKDFKEFYWNKDKFQSQSLMVFRKKRKRNMLWVLAPTFHDFSPKPSLLVQHLVHIRK